MDWLLLLLGVIIISDIQVCLILVKDVSDESFTLIQSQCSSVRVVTVTVELHRNALRPVCVQYFDSIV
jgi:hypothetical protein